MRLNQEPKEKAIESLTWIKEKLVISEDYKEAIDMAIEALKPRTTKHARGGWRRVGKVYVRRQK